MELKAETERLVKEEMRSGHFHSVDELIVEGIQAWREKHQAEPIAQPKLRKRLYDLLTKPPFAGSELDLQRHKDYPRSIDL